MATSAKHGDARRSGNPAKRQAADKTVQPATWRDWVAAARPRTLGMAIAPVVLGSAAAFSAEGFHLGIGLLCLALALLLQIGVNFANDYSDGVRGTDAVRVGPGRLVGAGRATPRAVRNVAIAFLAAGGVAGLAVAAVSGRWWLLAVGAVCILAAWLYTGGPRPYGYLALGELMAFLFFGPVATAGTVYAMLGHVTEDAVWLGCAVGCFAAAVMLTNNLRDIDTDRAAGKRTVPTLIGKRASKVLFSMLVAAPFVILVPFALAMLWGALVYLVLLVAVPAIVIVWLARSPRDLITALSLTGLAGLLYGLALGFALWAGPLGFGAPIA